MSHAQESTIAKFLKLEAASGILLMAAATLAIIIANTPLSSFYQLVLNMPVEVRVGALEIAKPLLLWINDGLMAVFFFLVGLELKRELAEGELSDKRNIILPATGAIGGMAIPALVYMIFNADDPMASRGWAIPAATDIAFALGILALLGSRVPTSIKIFLTSLAIFDDIGAILIIAFFYTSKLSIEALMVVGLCVPVLVLMNTRKVESMSAYILVGVIMWISMLKSGVHATLAGVLLAAFVPLRSHRDPEYSPLKDIEHDLHSVVAFFVLPVFAFANAGLDLSGIKAEQVFHSVPVGVALGLFIGKIVGVFGFCWIAIKIGFARLPDHTNFPVLLGTSALCGVGFTMSLFIGSLAFGDIGPEKMFDERLGIIAGSLISGITGYLILRMCLPKGDKTT